jgi:hypothetical protein
MNCPRCKHAMTEFFSQGVLIDFGTGCRGSID